MKAYLITTGSIFALMAVLHLWRGIAEAQTASANPGEFFSMAALGLVAAGISAWAWSLLAKQPRQ